MQMTNIYICMYIVIHTFEQGQRSIDKVIHSTLHATFHCDFHTLKPTPHRLAAK